MIAVEDRQQRVDPPPLTERQHTVRILVESYYEVAHEMPSAGWVARRLSISRKRAWEHVEALRRKGWCAPTR